MAGISTFSTRAAFVTPDLRLSREASQLIESLIAAAGGALGENGDEVFASGGAVDQNSLALLLQDSLMQSSGDAQYLSPMDMQPISQAPHDAPMVQQPAEQQSMFEMVMQPQDNGGAPFSAVTPGASPYAYAATMPGSLSVQAGTISAITVTREATAVTVTGATLVPVNTGDIVTITYTVAPTVNFLPR